MRMHELSLLYLHLLELGLFYLLSIPVRLLER